MLILIMILRGIFPQLKSSRILHSLTQTILKTSPLKLSPKKPFIQRKILLSSMLLMLFNTIQVNCSKQQQQQPQFQQLTMQQLVHILHKTQEKQFVLVIYNKFKKNKNPKQFASELKDIITQCKQANVSSIYTISSKDAQFLSQITRRLKNKQKDQHQKSSENSTFECHFKSKHYPETFSLLNSKDYKISQQINELRHFQIQINQPDIVPYLHSHLQNPFNFTKNIIVKQCLNQGQCVDSFKRQVKKLIDNGLLARKKEQFQFKLVVDHPTGLLHKSTEYVKEFNAAMFGLGVKTKKEDTILFRNDVLGKDILIWSQWLQKYGMNYSKENRMLMFLRPRINIISKYSMFSDLLWYLRTSRINGHLSLSLNNTQNWHKQNSSASLQVLKLLYKNNPHINYLIINSKAAGQLIHHVHADHKYVIFQQSHEAIWKKQFLDLDRLQNIQNPCERQQTFQKQFKQKINSFIDKPQIKDTIVVEKQMQINFNKLKQLKLKQLAQQHKKYLIRICQQRCNRSLPQAKLDILQQKIQQKLDVYWLDNTAQNIGLPPGDYLLSRGEMHQLQTLLKQTQQ